MLARCGGNGFDGLSNLQVGMTDRQVPPREQLGAWEYPSLATRDPINPASTARVDAARIPLPNE